MTIEKQHALLVAQQNQQNLQAEQKKDELIALANNISNNLTSMVVQQQMQPQQPTVNVIPTATVLPPTSATIIPGQVISTAPVLSSQAPLISQTSQLVADQPLITNTLPVNPTLNPIINPIQCTSFPTNLPQPGQFQTQFAQPSGPMAYSQPLISQGYTGLGKELPCIPTGSSTIIPPHFDSFAPTSLRTIRPLRPTLSLGATQSLSRKDRRRLPFPTYEEIQQATVALGLNNRLSGLSTEKVVSDFGSLWLNNLWPADFVAYKSHYDPQIVCGKISVPMY